MSLDGICEEIDFEQEASRLNNTFETIGKSLQKVIQKKKELIADMEMVPVKEIKLPIVEEPSLTPDENKLLKRTCQVTCYQKYELIVWIEAESSGREAQWTHSRKDHCTKCLF